MKDKEIVLEINGREYTVIVDTFTAYEAEVRVEGKNYKVALKDLGAEIENVKPVAPESAPAKIQTAQPAASAPTHRPKILGSGNAIEAPLPGQITRIFIKEGDIVEVGQKVCMLEAMKMENEVNATVGGIIIDIRYREGDSVNQGDPIFLLKPAES